VNKRVDFDEYTENYNQLLKEKTQFFSPSEEYFARYKVDIVRQQRTEPVRRVLEYGCGIGRNIPFLQQAFPGAEVIGTDISGASLDIARQENHDVAFFLEDGKAGDLGEFDLIFVAGVYHHIPPAERVNVSSTILRRLSPNGSLFVFEHNPFNPVTRRIVNTCPYDADAVLLSPRELKSILHEAGFKIGRSAYCLFIPPSLRSLAPLEGKLGWLPLGGQYWVSAQASR